MSCFKKILPWLIAVAIFAILFYLYPPSEIVAALKSVRPAIFFPFAISYFVYIYLVDSWTTAKIFNHFGRHTTFRHILPARGVTYLMQVVNYAAGQASFGYYLKKRDGIPFSSSLSLFSFIGLIDLYWLVTFALIGVWVHPFVFEGIDLSRYLILFALAAYVGLILVHQFWRGPFSKRLKKSDNKILRWIYTHDFFHTFSNAGLKDYVCIAGYRFWITLPLNVSMFFALMTFETFVPFWVVFSAIPLVVIIGILPIAPGGLGTTNAATVILLSPFVTGELLQSGTFTAESLVLTASLAWMGINYFLKALFGTVCLKFASKDLFKA